MCEEKLNQLGDEREKIVQQIKSYPAPIPGCDEQYKWLLQRRRELDTELGSLSLRCKAGKQGQGQQ